ncbi:hypothetical protein ACFT9I_16765 [Streptomyces sp. NPDC057137]|uniref:hypothetical protein n=1 Tax=Streptomyces sp. NPDC057137 TaxID=3346030 RepID=UPI003624EC7A
MNEWGIALIAAGSALAGSLVTGWFARSAGMRQAEAAQHAGDRQADALLHTVRLTLQEQRAVRLLDLRRQTYVAFLEAAEAVALTNRTGIGLGGDGAALQRAFGAVALEGPAEVARAAGEVVDRLRRDDSPDDVERAKLAFIAAAQAALDPTVPGPE